MGVLHVVKFFSQARTCFIVFWIRVLLVLCLLCIDSDVSETCDAQSVDDCTSDSTSQQSKWIVSLALSPDVTVTPDRSLIVWQ